MTPRLPLRLPQPQELALPLRDLMRGVQQAVRIPMDLAQPVVSHLPGPLRDTLSQIGARAEAIYKDSLTIWRPSASEIELAASRLQTAQQSDLAVTGQVVAWALDVALSQDESPASFVSETAVTLTLQDTFSDMSSDTDTAARAAQVMLALLTHGFGPPPPEFPIGKPTPERTEQMRIAAFAAMLFLLAQRPEQGTDEIRILSYAITIAELIAADISAAGRDATAIATLLQTHAEMI